MNEKESVVVVVVVIGSEQSISEVMLKDKCIAVCMILYVVTSLLAHCPWALTDRALCIVLKQHWILFISAYVRVECI